MMEWFNRADNPTGSTLHKSNIAEVVEYPWQYSVGQDSCAKGAATRIHSRNQVIDFRRVPRAGVNLSPEWIIGKNESHSHIAVSATRESFVDPLVRCHGPPRTSNSPLRELLGIEQVSWSPNQPRETRRPVPRCSVSTGFTLADCGFKRPREFAILCAGMIHPKSARKCVIAGSHSM